MSIFSTTLKLHHSAEESAAHLPDLMLKAEKAVTSVMQGEHAQKRSGHGEKFWQFRDYVPGDRPQDIDWRQSAKADRVFIRQKERQTTQSAIFWCSHSPGMNFSSSKKYPAKAEAAKVLTLALAILMTRAGEQIGLFGAGRTGRTDSALHLMGEALCASGPESRELPDADAYSLPRHCSLIQIGDFLEPPDEINSVFKKLSAHTANGLVIQIIDPAEMELPYSGRYIFEDPAAKTSEQVNHVDSIRDKYKQRINDHIEAVRTVCRNRHWEHHLHTTDADISSTLLKVWEAMAYHNSFGRKETFL